MPSNASVVVDQRGVRHATATVRSKQHAPGIVYGGKLHPTRVPSVPTHLLENGKPVVSECNGEGQVMKRFLVHQEVPFSDLFREARCYARSGDDTDLIPQPMRGYAGALRDHEALPDQVVCTNGKVMTRERWMMQGIVVAKPAIITTEQATQLLAAAYWTRESRSHDYTGVLRYYQHSGHTVVLKRPYSHRPAMS